MFRPSSAKLKPDLPSMSKKLSFGIVFLGIVAAVLSLTTCTPTSSEDQVQLSNKINQLSFQADLDSMVAKGQIEEAAGGMMEVF
jgi:hypothetical protein